MAALLFRSTVFWVFCFFFATKENIVKFLIRQKETGNLETERRWTTQSAERGLRDCSKAAFWLYRPMTLYMMLRSVLLECVSLMVEAGSFGEGGGAASTGKTNHLSHESVASAASLFSSWTVFSFSTLRWQKTIVQEPLNSLPHPTPPPAACFAASSQDNT